MNQGRIMKVYIINLKKSENRRSYIEKLLSPYASFLDFHFIEAVNGRDFSEKQLSEIWNQKETYKTYGRYMKSGEIGCALSHRKCYEEILKQKDEMALILEDDVSFQDVNVVNIIISVEKILQTEKPTVLLLSGDYWYTKKKPILGNEFQLASVHEAMGAIAYIVNRNAAERMISLSRKYLADDWYNIKKTGIRLYALYPHFVDTADLGTDISGDGYIGTIRKNLSYPVMLHSYYRAVIRQILGRMGHFEKRVCF